MIIGETIGACLILLASAFLGWRIQKALPTHHRSRDTVEAVRLVLTMLLTVSAIVLGLLTSSAKARHDAQAGDLESYSVDLVELDQRLRQYGPEAVPIRELLRAYTAAAIADTWPDEPPPSGAYPRIAHVAGLESVTLGEMLENVDRMIEELAPSDEFHQQTAARLRNRVATSLQARWRLIASAHSTISWPFLFVLMFWLVIIFAAFGLSSPDNALVYTVVIMGAVSISSSLYLILDFDASQAGFMRMTSQPMREALGRLDRPPAPPFAVAPRR
jgi:hypothetical protein